MLPQRREVIGGDLTGEAEGIGAGSLGRLRGEVIG